MRARNPPKFIWFIVVLAAVALIYLEVSLYGTGFAGKTLWDWLQLISALAIPVVVGIGAAWYTAQQGKVSDKEHTDTQRETALQAYLDTMSKLLLDKDNPLRASNPGDDIRMIARARTLTVLGGLDEGRKASIIQFLYETNLIKEDAKGSIIDMGDADLTYAGLSNGRLNGVNLSFTWLDEADLQEADLQEANLQESVLTKANLKEADLTKANLQDANLIKANLKDAVLTKADLSGADLSGADLSGTNITDEQLKQAKSLKGAIMRDGSIHD